MLGELNQINRKELIQVLPIDVLVNEEATCSPALTGSLIKIADKCSIIANMILIPYLTAVVPL